MQTNNTVYENKHHYMFILKELNVLKNKTENEALNEEVSRVRVQEIHDIYTRIIIGLIEEGMEYQYVKHAKNSKKDIIRLNIDGTAYECRNTDIKSVLKDRYDKVMNNKYIGPELDDTKIIIPEGYVLPKVYLSPEAEKGKGKGKKVLSTLMSFLFFFALAGIIGFTLMQNKDLSSKLKNGYEAMVSQVRELVLGESIEKDAPTEDTNISGADTE